MFVCKKVISFNKRSLECFVIDLIGEFVEG